jgi:hypothetical protein
MVSSGALQSQGVDHDQPRDPVRGQAYRHGVRSDRVAAGLSGATLLVVLAVAPDVAVGLTAALLTAAGAVLLATFAPQLPCLHHLPILGAPRVELVLTLEAKDAADSGPRPAIRILRIGIKNAGPGELRRPRLTVLVPWPITLRPCDGFGELQSGRGERMPATSEELTPERPTAFWSERRDALDEDSTLAHYLLYGVPSGSWRARVKLASASLYRKRRLTEDIAFDVPDSPRNAPDAGPSRPY